jgi:hypothetical protein
MRIFIVDSSSWISFSFYAFPSILFTCVGQDFSKRFPKLPNKQITKRLSLPQSTFNEPTTHHLINIHHPKDSIKQRKRVFIVDSSSWLSTHLPVFLLPNTQASFCDPAFHWSDPQSSQTIIIVSLNLLRIHYTSSHQIPPSSKRQYQAKKEIFIVEPLSLLSTHPPVFLLPDT